MTGVTWVRFCSQRGHIRNRIIHQHGIETPTQFKIAHVALYKGALGVQCLGLRQHHRAEVDAGDLETAFQVPGVLATTATDVEHVLDRTLGMSLHSRDDMAGVFGIVGVVGAPQWPEPGQVAVKTVCWLHSVIPIIMVSSPLGANPVFFEVTLLRAAVP